MSATIPLIVLWGATAVGKTALAIAVCQALHGEIVSADSRQLYRGMDIGTAKPTADERAQAVHHLIDIADPDDDVSLATYLAAASAAIADIHQRGRLPLLVGGTGQYVTALIEGWRVPQVAPDADLRAHFEAFADAHGDAALFARLLALDPACADFVDGRNRRRVIRALEVCTLTGEPFSAQRQRQPTPYRPLLLGVTRDPDALRARADARVEAMMAAGFVAEVADLLACGYDRRLPAMSGLGYAQIAAHLIDGVPLTEAVASTKTATHAYIRRQRSWFRGHDGGTRWFDAGAIVIDVLIDSIRDHAAVIREE